MKYLKIKRTIEYVYETRPDFYENMTIEEARDFEMKQTHSEIMDSLTMLGSEDGTVINSEVTIKEDDEDENFSISSS